MNLPLRGAAVDPAATGLLFATLAVAGVFETAGIVTGVLIALVGLAGSVLLRAVGAPVPGVLVPVPALLALAVIAVGTPATVLTELLVGSAALALLYWNGADGSTAARGADRSRALALPGLATIIAALVPLIVPAFAPSVGIGVAAVLLVLVLVAAAAYLVPPGALRGAAPSS